MIAGIVVGVIGLVLVLAGLSYLSIGRAAASGKRALDKEVSPDGLKKFGVWLIVTGFIVISTGGALVLIL